MLTFKDLRRANILRQRQFKNRRGESTNSTDWTPAQWLQALVGEVGEYANVRKKFEHGELTTGEFYSEACKELADIQIYLDILAREVGVDLEQATREKFNLVSQRIGSDVFLRD